MTVGTLRIEIFIPMSRSLKEKRRVVKSLVDRLRGRFNVSVAEVEHQETWQRAGFGIGAVGSSAMVVRRTLDAIMPIFRAPGPALLKNHEIEIF